MRIRNMRREEVDLALDWAAREGWNPGIHDAEPFFLADPRGFFIGEVDGETAATGSLVRYPGEMSFAGFLIVRPDLRGQGFGRQMLDHLMGIGKKRNVGGDGVPEMVSTYLRKGFAFAHWNHRYAGLGGGRCPKGLTPAGDVDPEELKHYDAEIFGADRCAFITSFLAQKGTISLVVVASHGIKGFGAIRPCRTGHKIGPLFADDRRTAESILHGLVSTVPGKEYFLDVPEPNAAGMAMVRDLELEERFTTARIYTQRAPDTPIRKAFGITSFELG